MFLSQTTAVSRWLVMPTAAMSCLVSFALPSAWPITSPVLCQICMGSCSTQPALGKICSCSSCPVAMIDPFLSKMIERVLVVPWSIARM
ncbi:hypothetical protein ASE68_09885 [Agromyces sp. Leaf222]|nr:hypothetical protein ASE68_09885 [Agromyces sp. Leaf222]